MPANITAPFRRRNGARAFDNFDSLKPVNRQIGDLLFAGMAPSHNTFYHLACMVAAMVRSRSVMRQTW